MAMGVCTWQLWSIIRSKRIYISPHSCPLPITKENEPVPEAVAQLAQEVYGNDLLLLLVTNIGRFEFEAKKDVSQIFNNLLRRQIGSRSPTVEYLTTREEILFILLKGYSIFP